MLQREIYLSELRRILQIGSERRASCPTRIRERILRGAMPKGDWPGAQLSPGYLCEFHFLQQGNDRGHQGYHTRGLQLWSRKRQFQRRRALTSRLCSLNRLRIPVRLLPYNELSGVDVHPLT